MGFLQGLLAVLEGALVVAVEPGATGSVAGTVLGVVVALVSLPKLAPRVCQM